jgi:PAS domain S-box-containing protein
MTDTITTTLLEQLDTLVLAVNKSGNVEYISPSAKRLLGYDVQSLLGDGWWNLTRSKSDGFLHKAEIIKLFNDPENSKSLSFERELFTRDGRRKWILWNISVNEGDTIVGVGQDITSQKQIELQLRERTNEVSRQKRIIEAKNKDITDSINYAKKIQLAILPDEDGLQKYFPESFILYKPKDIVSGDFYWYHKAGNKIFVVAADCTGHGVPGAIMSVIGNGLVRDAILKRGLNDPAEILHEIDYELDVLLNKDTSAIKTPDGMDVALAVFDLEDNTVKFSGAFRPLILLRKNEIIEFQASRFPVGLYEAENKKFETHVIRFEEGDKFYLFSDGYIDQFGGEKGRKLNRKRFYEFLLGSNDMEMEEQGSFLDYSLNNWRQDELQTDDVLLIGVKV